MVCRVIREAIERAQTRLMVAIDNPKLDLGFVADLVSSMRALVVGFKFGTPFMLNKSLRTVRNIIEAVKGTYFLADLKLGDTAQMMEYVAEVVWEAGFNGLVANAFMGFEGAIDRLARKCDSLGLELFLQVSFDHPASRIIDSKYPEIKMVVARVDPKGLVVPASKTTMLRDLRETFGNRYVILSPGIFAAGAQPGEGLCYGADAEIVGSYVVSASSPLEALNSVIKSQARYLSENRSKCLAGW